MINFLELTHASIGSATAINSENIVGLNINAALVDPNDILPDLSIQLSNISLTKTASGTYANLVTRVNNSLLSSISSKVLTHELKYILNLIKVDGSLVPVLTEQSPIEEYRVDEGAANKSVTFTIRNFSKDALGADTEVFKYSSKSKKVENAVDIYTHTLESLLYKFIGVGKLLTDAGVVTTVTSKTLTMNGSNSTFVVGSQ